MATRRAERGRTRPRPPRQRPPGRRSARGSPSPASLRCERSPNGGRQVSGKCCGSPAASRCVVSNRGGSMEPNAFPSQGVSAHDPETQTPEIVVRAWIRSLAGQETTYHAARQHVLALFEEEYFHWLM